MGVKDLWSILEPVKSHKPLKDLCGQTLAVDLSIWMCDTQQLQGVVQKPHLRNIFFRVLNLVQLGVKPVFVIDGTPPEVKWDTIQKRLGVSGGPVRGGGHSRGQYRAGGARGGAPQKVSRSHFKRLADECCVMLDSLGVPYIQSQGEAEAMCALLNAEGLVDACITNDGDAFLYGARTVYKNFTLNNKDPHVESYNMSDIENDLGLSQDSLVALSLLLGCDYLPKGVPGVGKEISLKLMKELQGENILNRFKSWSSDSLLELHKGSAKKLTHCGLCEHVGSQREHQRSGCNGCKSDKYCEPNTGIPCMCSWHIMQRGANGRASEIIVWRKAKDVAGFPNQQVINEFLIRKDKVPSAPFIWKRPKPFQFHKFATEKMEWEGTYPMEKIIPLLTLIDMRMISNGTADQNVIQPHSIVKARVKHGTPSLELHWFKLDHDDITEEPYYVTVEDHDLVAACFPKMVCDFLELQNAKKKKPRVKKKAVDDLDFEKIPEVVTKISCDVDLAAHLHSMKNDWETHNTRQNAFHPIVGIHREENVEHVPKDTIKSTKTYINQDSFQKKCDGEIRNVKQSGVSLTKCEEDVLPLMQRLALKSKETREKSGPAVPMEQMREGTVEIEDKYTKIPMSYQNIQDKSWNIQREVDHPVLDGVKHASPITENQHFAKYGYNGTCENFSGENCDPPIDSKKTEVEEADQESSSSLETDCDMNSSSSSSTDMPGNSIRSERMEKSETDENHSQKSQRYSTSQKMKKKSVRYKQMHELFDLCSILEQSSISDSVIDLTTPVMKSEEHEPLRNSVANGKLLHKVSHFGSSCSIEQEQIRKTQTPDVNHIPRTGNTEEVIEISTPTLVRPKHLHQALTQNMISPIPMNDSLTIAPTPERHLQPNKLRLSESLEKVMIPKGVTEYAGAKVKPPLICGNHSYSNSGGNFHIETSVLSNWSQCSGLESTFEASGKFKKHADLAHDEVDYNSNSRRSDSQASADGQVINLVMESRCERDIGSKSDTDTGSKSKRNTGSGVEKGTGTKMDNDTESKVERDTGSKVAKSHTKPSNIKTIEPNRDMHLLNGNKENNPDECSGWQEHKSSKRAEAAITVEESPLPLSLADRLRTRLGSSKGRNILSSISSQKTAEDKILLKLRTDKL